MDTKKALLALRSLGIRKVIGTIRYSFLRDRLDREYLQHIQAGRVTPPTHIAPGSLRAVQPAVGEACFEFEHARVTITFLAQDLVRVAWEPGQPPVPYALAKEDWPEVEIDLIKSANSYLLASRELEVLVQEDATLIFRTPTGSVLRTDYPPDYLKTSAAGPVAWMHRTHLAAQESIYGLGERSAPLDLRGRAYQMWNLDPGGSYMPGADPLYLCIPAYFALHLDGSYLVFYENSYRARFEIGLTSDRKENSSSPAQEPTAEIIEARFEDGQLRYYFIPGPPERALERFTELTGRPAMPPRWVLGYHQCRWGYKTESEIRDVAEGFIKHDLPLGAIHLDIDYMDGFRVFTVDSRRFPDLKKLASNLAGQDIRLVAIVDPGVKVDPGYAVYQSGVDANAFCKLPCGELAVGQVWPGKAAYPDFTSPAARSWWKQQYAALLECGIAGIWHDMNEPASLSAWGEMTLPLSTQHDLEGRQGDHRQAHNLYGLLMNQAGYEAMLELRPDRRPWLVTRSGWAGAQRYAWAWTGDVDTSWEALRGTIPTVLGLGLSGIPFTGPDTGGFSGNPSAELYLRWFQLSAFLPYFRTHSVTGMLPREPWVFGEPYLSILRDTLKLRQRLLPYLYTVAWHTSQTGHPPVRPLFWGNLDRVDLWKADDAFFLGQAFLVAPVVEQGSTRRTLKLPVGDWYSFWENETFEGAGEVSLPAPLERVPLLVRAGTILPMEENDQLVLQIYPRRGSVHELASGMLYSDAGDGYGAWRIDRFLLVKREGKLILSCRSEGEYPFPYSRVQVHLHGDQPRSLEVEAELVFQDGLEL